MGRGAQVSYSARCCVGFVNGLCPNDLCVSEMIRVRGVYEALLIIFFNDSVPLPQPLDYGNAALSLYRYSSTGTGACHRRVIQRRRRRVKVRGISPHPNSLRSALVRRASPSSSRPPSLPRSGLTRSLETLSPTHPPLTHPHPPFPFS